MKLKIQELKAKLDIATEKAICCTNSDYFTKNIEEK